MKKGCCIAKIIAAAAAVVGIVLLVRAYRDTLEDVFYTIVGKIKEKKAQYAEFFPSEFDDYADGEI